MTEWLERYRGYLFITLLNLILIGGAVFFLRYSQGPPNQPIIITAPTSVPTPTVAPLVVYVSGAVANPGVYSLPDGSRVADALNAAGGATAEADLSRINLAKHVSDAEQVHIPKIGEAAPTQAAPGVPSGKININTATAAELDQLPGIGPALAQRIIDYRTQNGPFKTIEDLKKVKGIGDALFEQIKDRITVR
jgi:competence protein ComEA